MPVAAVDPSSNLAPGSAPDTDVYRVRGGDSLSSIAADHGVSLAALEKANPQILHPDMIRAGQAIHIPATDAPPVQADYTVKSGDTLSSIARKFGVDWRLMAQVNGIQDPKALRVGTVLHLGGAPANGNAAPAAKGNTELGALSARFESNGNPGTVSTGKGDKGGVSYGAYQITTANVSSFVANDGKPWAADFAGKTPGAADFNAAWKAAAAQDPQAFMAAQHSYIERSHYDVQADQVQGATGLDLSQHSKALQNVVWSTAVQHGGKTSIVQGAVAKVQAGGAKPGDASFDRQVINAVYDERGRTDAKGTLVHFSGSSAKVQQGVADRFVAERKAALSELAAGH